MASKTMFNCRAAFSLPRLRHCLGLFCTMLAISWSVPGLVVAEETPEGLSGLLPSEIPDGLDRLGTQAWPEGLAEFPETVTENLAKLYSFMPEPIAVQRESLHTLRDQISLLHQALASDAAFEYFDLLADVEGKLTRRVDVLEASLNILTSTEGDLAPLRQEMQSFLKAIEEFEADALEGNANQLVRAQLDKLADLADTAELEEVVRIHYYNFNFRTFISQPFAEYAFNECRRECGPVCDFILGARVSGSQRTNSGVSIQFVPSDDSARFSINIQGNTRTNTRGVTDQATVFTYGNHFFNGKKNITYKDSIFTWEKARLWVNPNNTVTDAKLNRRGLIAKLIGDKIAYNKAVSMTPKTESVAASRVRGRVLPKFNNEIEETFTDLNAEQERRRERMAEVKIAPNEVLSRTDRNELRNAERLMNPGQLGADRPSTLFNTPTGMTLHLHESWVNNALARPTLEPASNEISFPDFGRLLTEKFERAFDLEIERDSVEDDGDRVIIYDTDPLHVQFDNGRIKLVLRVGLIQAGRDDVIKHRRVEIPLRIIMEQNEIRLAVAEEESDRVRVLPLDPSDRRPIANRIIGDKIREKMINRLSEKTFDRHLIYEAGKDKDKEIPVTIAEIHAVNGWLIIVVEPTSEEDLAKSETIEETLQPESTEENSDNAADE